MSYDQYFTKLETLKNLQETILTLGDNLDFQLEKDNLLRELKKIVQEMILKQTCLRQQVQDQSEELKSKQELREQLSDQSKTITKDFESKCLDEIHSRDLSIAVDQDIETALKKEAKLIEEIKYQQNLLQHYQEKEAQFFHLYSQCESISILNYQTTQNLVFLKKDNHQLYEECSTLSKQTDHQKEYIQCLQKQNQKTDEIHKILDMYQKQIKTLIQQKDYIRSSKINTQKFKRKASATQSNSIQKEFGQNYIIEKSLQSSFTSMYSDLTNQQEEQEQTQEVEEKEDNYNLDQQYIQINRDGSKFVGISNLCSIQPKKNPIKGAMSLMTTTKLTITIIFAVLIFKKRKFFLKLI